MIATQNLEVGEVKSQNLTLDSVITQNNELLARDFIIFENGILGENCTQNGFTISNGILSKLSQITENKYEAYVLAENVNITALREVKLNGNLQNSGTTNTTGYSNCKLFIDNNLIVTKTISNQGDNNLSDIIFDISQYSGRKNLKILFDGYRSSGTGFYNCTISINKMGVYK